jgi:EPS-associated MarR family transcriptional regulator
MLNDEIHYRILRELERDPQLSQRQLADSLGVSVGKTNYCVRALVEKGLLKVENFRRSQNKLAYAYQLTPRGWRRRRGLLAGSSRSSAGVRDAQGADRGAGESWKPTTADNATAGMTGAWWKRCVGSGSPRVRMIHLTAA